MSVSASEMSNGRSPESPTLSLAERDRRWARLRGMMDELGLEGLVVFGQRGRERFEGYLSNEHLEGVVILPRRDDPSYVTWTHHRITRRFAQNMRQTDFWIDDVRVGPTGQTVAAILQERGLHTQRIGVVGLDSKAPGEMQGIIPYRTWAAILEALPDASFVDVTVEFSKVMLIKSPEERILVRHAADIGERACQAMLDVTRPGVKERDIYAAIMEVIHKSAAFSPPPNLIISIGADDVGWAPPYWTYAGGESRVVQQGDLVQAEIFPVYGGLEAQMQMSIAIEPVPAIIRDLASIARRCYEIGLERARPGVSFQDLAEAMAQPIQENGLWTLTPMVHSVSPVALVGHIGINIESAPQILGYKGVQTIPPLNDIVLEPGIPLAFEPNACSGLHRVNIGGTVLIDEEGAVELNTLATRMIVT